MNFIVIYVALDRHCKEEPWVFFLSVNDITVCNNAVFVWIKHMQIIIWVAMRFSPLYLYIGTWGWLKEVVKKATLAVEQKIDHVHSFILMLDLLWLFTGRWIISGWLVGVLMAHTQCWLSTEYLVTCCIELGDQIICFSQCIPMYTTLRQWTKTQFGVNYAVHHA